MASVFFRDQQLGLQTDKIFDISKNIDFFILGDNIIIPNKRNFESILIYKQAHREDFATLQSEPEFSAIFSTLDPLVNFVGDNKIQLRRVSAIKQKGHYKDTNFMSNLTSGYARYGLTINFDAAGKIVPCENTCRDIVQALLDHRLVSGFSNNIYDVADAVAVRP